MADSDVFSADPVDPNESVDLTLNDLVGEGRKYKDPDELAKAYANIERHARTLEAENADYRARVDQANNQGNRNNPDPTGQEQANQPDPAASPPKNEAPKSGEQVDFRSQIKEEIKALNEQERAVQNTEMAAAKMVEVYGSAAKANEAVQQRARELGVSVEWLRDSASRSPQAFYATMGITGNSGSRTTPASGEGHRLENQGGTGRRDFEYYDRIRREDPKRYFSTATQQEMLRQARAMGDDFYKRQ